MGTARPLARFRRKQQSCAPPFTDKLRALVRLLEVLRPYEHELRLQSDPWRTFHGDPLASAPTEVREELGDMVNVRRDAAETFVRRVLFELLCECKVDPSAFEEATLRPAVRAAVTRIKADLGSRRKRGRIQEDWPAYWSGKADCIGCIAGFDQEVDRKLKPWRGNARSAVADLLVLLADDYPTDGDGYRRKKNDTMDRLREIPPADLAPLRRRLEQNGQEREWQRKIAEIEALLHGPHPDLGEARRRLDALEQSSRIKLPTLPI